MYEPICYSQTTSSTCGYFSPKDRKSEQWDALTKAWKGSGGQEVRPQNLKWRLAMIEVQT